MGLLIAAKTAFVNFKGEKIKIIKDVTIAREAHEIVAATEGLWRRLEVHFDVPRPVKAAPPAPKQPAPKPEPAPAPEKPKED
jgi:hypothetical protein